MIMIDFSLAASQLRPILLSIMPIESLSFDRTILNLSMAGLVPAIQKVSLRDYDSGSPPLLL
jgi:hypothetical protein